jgi:hypothetical protein
MAHDGRQFSRRGLRRNYGVFRPAMGVGAMPLATDLARPLDALVAENGRSTRERWLRRQDSNLRPSG